MDREMVWVLWWRYHDGSAAEVLRAYANEERAREDLELAEGSDKQYILTPVALYK